MKAEPPRASDKASTFPEPRAAASQYEDTGPKPFPDGPSPSAGEGERRPTQDRRREAAGRTGPIAADARDQDEAPDGDDVAVTSGEAIRAFGKRS
jgi:hypothetical protein